jgi:hypothetical protein
MTLFRTFRYLNEVHSANLEGNVEIKLCDSASLRDKRVSCIPCIEVAQDTHTSQVRS